MNIPRLWRTEKTRYGLIGEVCRVCHKSVFPPRDVCPHCTEAEMPTTPSAEIQGREGPSPERRG